MDLGLKNDQIKLVPYQNEWQVEFLKVQEEIQRATLMSVERIEHIGSTAIKEMMAKPILDILVGVDNLTILEKNLLAGLKSIGFLRLRVERPDEIVFAKFTDSTYQEKTHYLHLVEFESDLWKNLIFFRNYLRENQEARMQYINIKLQYLQQQSTGINAYTDYKEAFVKSIYEKRKG